MFLLPLLRWLNEYRKKQIRFEEYLRAADPIMHESELLEGWSSRDDFFDLDSDSSSDDTVADAASNDLKADSPETSLTRSIALISHSGSSDGIV